MVRCLRTFFQRVHTMDDLTLEHQIHLVSQVIASRQTILPKRLTEPGPHAQELAQLFRAAAAAPDHDLINPWRFLLIPLKKRADLGELFAQALLERDPTASDEQVAQARDKALRSPLLMVLIVDAFKGDPAIDLNERVLSAGSAVQNFMLLAHAMGYGTGLTSGKALKAESFRSGLKLREGEHALCFLSVGTVSARKPFKPRPDVSQFVQVWGDDT
jgi:nitroreductase